MVKTWRFFLYQIWSLFIVALVVAGLLVLWVAKHDSNPLDVTPIQVLDTVLITMTLLLILWQVLLASQRSDFVA